MRMSQLFQMLREVPAGCRGDQPPADSARRAGPPDRGRIWDYLPLGMRQTQDRADHPRGDDAMGAREVELPVVHAELWQRTGRWYKIGSDMARLKDRADRDMVLGMTHEEIMAERPRMW
ncbi:MAG: hypothetical protein R2838_03590 [Caldilineaceae bacterium]